MSGETTDVRRAPPELTWDSCPARRRVGQDEVNQAMIRHFVEAVGDENPVYTDAEAARASGFPE